MEAAGMEAAGMEAAGEVAVGSGLAEGDGDHGAADLFVEAGAEVQGQIEAAQAAGEIGGKLGGGLGRQPRGCGGRGAPVEAGDQARLRGHGQGPEGRLQR